MGIGAVLGGIGGGKVGGKLAAVKGGAKYRYVSGAKRTSVKINKPKKKWSYTTTPKSKYSPKKKVQKPRQSYEKKKNNNNQNTVGKTDKKRIMCKR